MNHVMKQLIHVARNSGMSYVFQENQHTFILPVPGDEFVMVLDPVDVETDGIDVASLKLKSFVYACLVECTANWRSHVLLETKRIGSIREVSIERNFICPSVFKSGIGSVQQN